jgi:hypothetical protein
MLQRNNICPEEMHEAAIMTKCAPEGRVSTEGYARIAAAQS